jgi:NAD(P)-dependent dehydrogenase (short-subunit alcohol dehydrogenase family)
MSTERIDRADTRPPRRRSTRRNGSSKGGNGQSTSTATREQVGAPAAAETRSSLGAERRPETATKVALVTGGAQGLGAAIVEEFATAGMRVVVADVRAEAAREHALTLDPNEEHVSSVGLDVADAASAEAAIASVIDRFGQLDVLVNNAGIDVTLPFDEIEPSKFDRIIDVNLRGPVNMSRAALPALRASSRGMILNIVSTAAKRAWPNASAYHASKWGLLGFSHALHSEARAYGVRVTAVICGGMRTPFLLDRFPELDPAVLQDPAVVARTIRSLIDTNDESVVPEITILPMRETSWP